MMRSTMLMLIAALASFGVAYTPTLLAQTDSNQSASTDQSAPSEESAPTYSDRELHSFAVALLEVERIKSSYAPKLEQNLREQAQVKQAASLEFLQALKQQGMSIDKYQEMLATVQSNPQLAAKVTEYVKKSAAEKGMDPGGSADEQPTPKDNGDTDSKQHVEEL
jgi:Domain of unknown function (DUF4168)